MPGCKTSVSAAALASALLLLQGCSSGGPGQNYWSQYGELLGQAYRNSFVTQSVSLDQAAAIPYASLGYRINGGSQNLLVLATDTNGDQIWTAASSVVLLTRGGRIIRTVNLPRDRAATTAQNGGALPPLAAAIKAPYRSTKLVDVPDIGAYSVALNCVTSARGRQMITILGTPMPTMRVDETCRSTAQRWSFTDIYWIDPDNGFAWRSVQHVHSTLRLEIEIFRPPE